jgi:hypothetical protein
MLYIKNIMDKVYIVEASFGTYDGFYTTIIGIYTDEQVANSERDKWERFYTIKKKEIFTPDLKDDDGDDSMEYYEMLSKYEDIAEFQSIRVDEFDLNKHDYVNKDVLSRSPELKLLMKQWDREYKINDLIGE